MLYHIITKEMSNGFEYVMSAKSVYDEEEALSNFKEIVNSLKNNFKDEETTISQEHLYAQDENNMKGNGHSVELLTDDKVMEAIMTAVDNSQKTIEWKHFGDVDYVLEAKTFELNVTEETTNTEILYIVKRPYDPENPWDDDSIYDVHMLDNGDEFVESLEALNNKLILAIYFKIIEYGTESKNN